MRRRVRFLAGITLGGAGLLAYLSLVGVEQVVARATAIAPGAVGAVALFVVSEAVADGIGVWASIRPLGRGLTGPQSVQFALAGDFFDTLSPAGPVSSEPIMARFIGVTTATTYSEAIGVRSVAKYVKAGTQVGLSTLLALAVVVDGTWPDWVVIVLGGTGLSLLVLGALLLWSRSVVSRALVALLTPFVTRISALYRDDPHGRDVVVDAVDRFWLRIFQFRAAPGLLVLIGVGAVLEQVLLAGALWTALAGTGTLVPIVLLVAIVPVPQISSVVPIPASLGAYDVAMSGTIAALTGASPVAAAAAVLVVRSVSLLFRIGFGGVAVAFLRGWKPGASA